MAQKRGISHTVQNAQSLLANIHDSHNIIDQVILSDRHDGAKLYNERVTL